MIPRIWVTYAENSKKTRKFRQKLRKSWSFQAHFVQKLRSSQKICLMIMIIQIWYFVNLKTVFSSFWQHFWFFNLKIGVLYCLSQIYWFCRFRYLSSHLCLWSVLGTQLGLYVCLKLLFITFLRRKSPGKAHRTWMAVNTHGLNKGHFLRKTSISGVSWTYFGSQFGSTRLWQATNCLWNKLLSWFFLL